MHGIGALGAVVILLAVVGIAMFGGWWMPGPSWMPHMGWGRGQGTGIVQSPNPGAPSLSMAFVDFAFRPQEIRARAGQPVNLKLVNGGRITHDLTIPALGFQAVVQPGQETTVGLPGSATGTYEFYCSIPGHREAGMIGRLVVTP